MSKSIYLTKFFSWFNKGKHFSGPIDTGSSVAIDELSPTSTGAKVDSTGHQGPFGMNEECSGMEGGGSPTPPQTLTLRLIMQGKEVGSIIGKVRWCSIFFNDYYNAASNRLAEIKQNFNYF